MMPTDGYAFGKTVLAGPFAGFGAVRPRRRAGLLAERGGGSCRSANGGVAPPRGRNLAAGRVGARCGADQMVGVGPWERGGGGWAFGGEAEEAEESQHPSAEEQPAAARDEEWTNDGPHDSRWFLCDAGRDSFCEAHDGVEYRSQG